MTNIDNFLSRVSEAMEWSLKHNPNGFASRTVEPSPGDIFDVHYTSSYVERFMYGTTNYIIPLYKLIDGRYVAHHGYRDEGPEPVTWEDIALSVDEDDPEQARLEIVLTKNGNASPLDTAVSKISDWASRNPNQRESIILLNVVEKLRGN